MSYGPLIGAISSASGDWRWHALTSRLSLTCFAILAASIIGIAVCAQAMRRLRGGGARRRSPRELLSDNAGTATLEFALVFPLLLFLILLLTQTTLVMGGNLYVHYAAYEATRSAIVWIPQDASNVEVRNVYLQDSGFFNSKHDHIRLAAVYALVPISGRVTGDAINGPGGAASPNVPLYEQGLTNFFQKYGRTPPAWIHNLMPVRLRYADANTSIRVMITTMPNDDAVLFTPMADKEWHEFGPRDPITVQVTHRFFLSIPYVNGIFADGYHRPATGEGKYATVTAQYTLTNEGVDTNLPPLPSIPRVP